MPGTPPTTVRTHLSALRILLVLTVLTGVLYPLVVTAVAQAGFSHQANGSFLRRNHRVVGSSLLGQNFLLPPRRSGSPGSQGRPDPRWFQPRPSAGGYDPLASAASDLGPNAPRLVRTIERRRAAVAQFNHVARARVPADAVTASASGLDPHISAAYAYLQAERVAKARRLTATAVRKLVTAHVQQPIAGFLGSQRVNVVVLNAALATLR